MDENKFGILGQAKATSVAVPTTEMAKIITNEYVKVSELKEYCKLVESDLQAYYKNMETLTAAKNDSTKMIAEYKSRNKINATNSESLFQSLNELYKYKCELKSSYIAAQKALKSKKLKYKKIISSYESSWDEAVKGYNTQPVCVELHELERENTFLEQEIQKQEKIASCTRIQFTQLKENLEKTFLEKIVNFSKAMTEYADFVKSAKRDKENEPHQESKGNLKFRFLKPKAPPIKGIQDLSSDSNFVCSFDVTVFDDIMVPSENLESQNMEEDGCSPGQNDERQFSDILKDNEGLERSNEPTAALPTAEEGSNENSVQDDSKVLTVNENESEYFRAETSESRKIPGWKVQEMESNTKNSNEPIKKMAESTEKLKVGSGPQQTVEEAPKDVQMESEESFSETSYDKQFGSQKAENYEYQYPKTSSLSSDDLPGENLNENPGQSRLFYEQKPEDQLKENDIKSFTGFFTIGNDQDTSKPSIFKLF